jgi:sugar lactone lactonase YvrE
VLLDQPSTEGLKTLSVSITNNWALPIGTDPSGNTAGLKVLFGNFTNLGAFADFRAQSQVSTIAGGNQSGNANGAANSAGFNTPVGVCAAGNGVVYVVDYFGHDVRKISNGFVSTLAGSGTAGGANGIGTAATFNTPYGVAVNPVDGALIVTEVGGNRVRRVTTDGRVTTIAGSGTASEGDGVGTGATFNGPSGLAVSSTGIIYVTDYYGNTVRKITFSGGDPKLPTSYTVQTIAGTTAAGSSDGVGGAAGFNKPSGVAVGSDGNLFVADQANNSIRRVSSIGEVVTIAGTGTGSSVDGPGNTATFNAPRGITIVNNAVIVSERLGNRLRQITVANNGLASSATASGYQVATIAGAGQSGGTDGRGDTATFNAPLLISADPSGNVFVGDSGNTIREVTPISGFFPIGIPTGSASSAPVSLSNPDGQIPSTAGPTPYLTYTTTLASGATSNVRNWNFVVPAGVTAFEFTATVEADSSALTPPEGAVGIGSTKVNVRTLTGGASNLGFLNGPLSIARFNGPEYLALDAAGDLFTGDNYNSAVRLVSASGMVSTVAGTGFASGDVNGYGAAARFTNVSAVAATADGNTVFICDTGNYKIKRAAFLGGDRTNPNNWYVTTIAGTGTAGGNSSLQRGDSATFNIPVGLAMDSGGNLYVSEYSGNRLKRIVFTGGDPSAAANYEVTLLAGDTSSVSPIGGDTDSPSASSARFNHPNQIAIDASDNIYVADSSNHRIRVVTVDGVVTTLAGGVSGDTPSGTYVDGTGPAAHFITPSGVAIDSSGLIYVADSSDNHIRCITKAGVVTTLAGTGGVGASDGLGNVATFNNPASLAVTSSGTLYVGSTNDNGIRIVERIIGTGTRSAAKR